MTVELIKHEGQVIGSHLLGIDEGDALSSALEKIPQIDNPKQTKHASKDN